MSAITSPLRVHERVVCLATAGSASSSVVLWVEVLVGGLRPPRVVYGVSCGSPVAGWRELPLLPPLSTVREERVSSVTSPLLGFHAPVLGVREVGRAQRAFRAFSLFC